MLAMGFLSLNFHRRAESHRLTRKKAEPLKIRDQSAFCDQRLRLG